MEKPRVTPKDFFLWTAAMVSLYGSIVAFLALVFDYINYAFPDPLTSYYVVDPYSGGVSYEMASLLVLFPLFLVLMNVIRRATATDPSRKEVWIRRWALFLTLFLAGATLAVDLITLIMYFLNGEISERFIFKILLVFLVLGAGFLHFLADLSGYWDENRAKANSIAWGTAILVVITIASGFLIIGTPMQARLQRFDQQKVNDLQTIQSEILSYWQTKRELPKTLDELNDPILYTSVPSDPQTGSSYEYDVINTVAFKLCATFNAATPAYAITSDQLSMPAMGGTSHDVSDSWYHDAGQQCFTRNIDPSRYPASSAVPTGKPL